MAAQPEVQCPYPGLRRFDASNAHLYFGRERETQAVVDRLGRSRFLAVTGESGCGKSSLIRAGVIPALVAGGGTWRIVVTQPGEDPLGRLARALAQALPDPDAGPSAVPWTEIIEAALRSGSNGVAEVVRQARLGTNDKLFILVDQFEEIFRFKNSGALSRAGEDARAFVRLLLTATAAPDRRVHAMFTMRSDFLGDCAQFAGLPEAINRGEFLVSRMSREEMRRAITEPAAVAGTAIAARLVVRLLNEIGDNPGELPVLQHALMRTWLAWRDGHGDSEPMDVRHYEAIGTLEHALSRHADEVFAGLGTPELKDTAERVFRTLTDVPPGGRPVRRPTPFARLCAITAGSPENVETVVRAFAAPDRNFLSYPDEMTDRLPDNAIIDLTHESLITRWAKLREWVAGELRDVDLYRSLARDATLYQKHQRSLWRNPELAVAKRWRDEGHPNPAWAAQYAPGFEAALGFLEASDRRDRRQRMAVRAMLAGSVAVVVFAVAAFAWAQRAEARAQLANATAQTLRANAAISEKERLQRRIQELTIANPQLSEDAVRLRQENRELEWSILQLQQQSDRTEYEIARLRVENQNAETQLKRARDDRAQTQSLIDKEAQSIAALNTTRSQLEQDKKAREATWASLSEANRKLREAAIQAGMLPMEVGRLTSGQNYLRSPSASEAIYAPPMLSAPAGAEPNLDRLKIQLEQLERENLTLKRSVEELREHNRLLLSQKSEEDSRAARLRAERDQLEARNRQLNGDLRKAQDDLDQVRNTLEQRLAEHRNLALGVEALEWGNRQLDSAIATVKAENDEISQAIARKK